MFADAVPSMFQMKKALGILFLMAFRNVERTDERQS